MYGKWQKSGNRWNDRGFFFLKLFWKQFCNFVVGPGSDGFQKEMSVTQKEGITISLPKGNKPREYVKDLRPVSLSNVTYNIRAASIINRVKTILLNRVDEDQTGCVKGK